MIYGYDLSGNIVLIKDGKAGTTLSAENDDTRSQKDSETDKNVSESGYETDTNSASAVSDNADKSATENTGLTSGTTTMEYDSVNRLIKYNGKTVEYDKDGNMTYGPLDGEMAHFTYDCRNRLIAVKTDSGDVTHYRYDAENNRIGMTRNAGTDEEESISYVVDTASGDLSQVLVKETESETTYYTYGNGLIAQETVEKTENHASEYLIYHFNNVGSTVAVTDGKGAITHTYSYTPYGELISGKYGEVDYLYNGQYGVTSDANGLYYMRARYYNIDIKRFINQDILTGSIDSSKSLNRYAYVEGNPISYLDPFGLQPEDTSKIHKWMNTIHDWVPLISLTLQGLSVLFLCTGNIGLAKIADKLSDAATILSIANVILDIVDIIGKKDDKEALIKKLSIDLGTLIASIVFGKLGQYEAYTGNLHLINGQYETVSAKTMKEIAKFVDYLVSCFASYLF